MRGILRLNGVAAPSCKHAGVVGHAAMRLYSRNAATRPLKTPRIVGPHGRHARTGQVQLVGLASYRTSSLSLACYRTRPPARNGERKSVRCRPRVAWLRPKGKVTPTDVAPTSTAPLLSRHGPIWGDVRRTSVELNKLGAISMHPTRQDKFWDRDGGTITLPASRPLVSPLSVSAHSSQDSAAKPGGNPGIQTSNDNGSITGGKGGGVAAEARAAVGRAAVGVRDTAGVGISANCWPSQPVLAHGGSGLGPRLRGGDEGCGSGEARCWWWCRGGGGGKGGRGVWVNGPNSG